MILRSFGTKGISVADYVRNKQKEREERFLREEREEEFLRQFAEAKQNLQIARSNFNSATDEKLVEYYIYRMKAEESKLNYYLALAKKEQRSASGSGVRRTFAGNGGRCIQ